MDNSEKVLFAYHLNYKKRRKNMAETITEEIMADNLLKLTKAINQTERVLGIISIIKQRNSSLRYGNIIEKLQL